jgi:hypothetical protein
MPLFAKASCPRIVLVVALLFVTGAVAASGQGLPKEDLDYLVEHLMEVPMDHRFAAMPTTAGIFARGRWQGAVEVGWGTASAQGLDGSGPLVAATVGIGVADRRGIELTVFSDRISLSGKGGEQVLRPLWSQEIPLDLPQRAEIMSFDGELTNRGLGATFVWQLAPAANGRRWTWRAGAFYDRLDAKDVTTHYQLVSGAFAGTEGELDYSATYSYLAPCGEGEVRWPLGTRWEIAPHFGFFFPLPRRGFIGRIDGPGFDVSGDSDESRGQTPMGDPYLTLGVRLDDRRSGFGIDLGATAYQALSEGLVHEGIDQAFLFSLSWQSPRR